MKRSYAWLIVLTLCIAFGCREHYSSRSVVTYFWTSSGEGAVHHLFINGKLKGRIPYSVTAPTEENCDDRRKALPITMRSGRFNIEVKDTKGNTVYEETYRLRLRSGSTRISTSGDDHRGGSQLVHKGKKIIKEIYFDE